VIEPLMPVAKEAGRKKQRRFLILLGLKIWTHSRPARSQSLYRLLLTSCVYTSMSTHLCALPPSVKKIVNVLDTNFSSNQLKSVSSVNLFTKIFFFFLVTSHFVTPKVMANSWTFLNNYWILFLTYRPIWK
jgi:hypothetical protein